MCCLAKEDHKHFLSLVFLFIPPKIKELEFYPNVLVFNQIVMITSLRVQDTLVVVTLQVTTRQRKRLTQHREIVPSETANLNCLILTLLRHEMRRINKKGNSVKLVQRLNHMQSV